MTKSTEKLPVLFVGHGSPMNAIEDNEYTRAWTELGKTLPRPAAVLAISAHWYGRGTHVTGMAKPKTIHDYWGFPEELYGERYPAPGSLALAHEVQRLVTSAKVSLDEEWGLDHGTWVVLKRLFPKADVPVIQLSLDYTKPATFHYALGQELASLRQRGILILGSGDIVHNLGLVDFSEGAKPTDWALEFDAKSKALIEAGDHDALIHYEKLGHAAALSIPTPDHYLPLMYTLAAREPGEEAKFFAEGITFGTVSMTSVQFG